MYSRTRLNRSSRDWKKTSGLTEWRFNRITKKKLHLSLIVYLLVNFISKSTELIKGKNKSIHILLKV